MGCFTYLTNRIRVLILYLEHFEHRGITMSADFAHLHVHTEYSLLDGFSRTKKLVQQARALSMQYLAITDDGAMYGAIEIYKSCTSATTNPILRIEAHLTYYT